MTLGALEGYIVGITADRRWEEQAELLSRRGASILHGPTIDTLYLASDEDLRAATSALVADPPGYVVATTGIGMRAWLEAASSWGMGESLAQALSQARIVARGPKAAGAVQAGGLEVWARSASERMDDVLAVLLAEPLRGCTVAYQQFGMESPEMVQAIVDAGARVVEVPVYRWRIPRDTTPALRLVEAVCAGRVDAVTFTSAPAVHNLFAIAATGGMSDDLRRAFNAGGVTAACVGPVCAGGAEAEGVLAPMRPEVGRLGLLVRALGDHLAPRRCAYRLAGHEVVVQGFAIDVDGEKAELAPRERALFEALREAQGVYLPRPHLLTRIWGSPDTDPHLLEVTIGRLRRRLGPAGRAVEAKPGRGYRLAVGIR